MNMYEIRALSKTEVLFIRDGLRNQKEACGGKKLVKDCGIKKNKKIQNHYETVERYVTDPSLRTAGQIISTKYKKDKKDLKVDELVKLLIF